MDSREDRNWLWVEDVMDRSPLPWFFFAYMLFIALFSIYMFFDTQTITINLYINHKQLSQAFFTSFLIPFELISVKILLDGSRGKFYRLDSIFQRPQSSFYKLLKEKIIEQKLSYFLLFLLIGLPLFLLGWSGLSYYKDNSDNYIYLLIDIYNNLLLIISIYLFCVILWIFINIYWSFHIACELLDGNLSKYNIVILQRKILSARNFFLTMLLIFIITISSLYMSTMNTDYIIFNNYFLLALFLLGMVSTAIALSDAHNIGERAIDQKMERIDGTIESARREMESITENELAESKKKVEKLQKIIDLQQKDWDRITQEKIGLGLRENIKEAGTFIVSTVIPILTFLISKEFFK
jgi:hypothetical protein